MTEISDLAELLPRLSAASVLCVGDVMLDRFVYGSVDRISPEAPIPVLRVEREVAMLGGAGNVVRNLAALGAATAFLTAVGDDEAGIEVTGLVGAEAGVEPHVLIEGGRRTTIKTRLIAGSHQLLRTDHETLAPVGPSFAEALIARARMILDGYRVVAISDYAKGLLADTVLGSLIEGARAKGSRILVDPKGRDYARYAGAHILTPNRRELADATGGGTLATLADVEAAARSLMARVRVEAVLVTLSQDGMMLVSDAGRALHLPAQAREVFDVSGAGDTVIAALAACLGAGIAIEDACRIANAAAGVVVAKIGTAVARPAEIADAMRGRDPALGEHKILDRDRLAARVAAWRAEGLKVGFTNGCFDLLHPGHVSLLGQARAACDRLVVGLNDDASVKRLKGETRPVQGEHARAIVLASLGMVDAVTLFSEDTPRELIQALLPDVLVKGADYTVETVVGSDIVLAAGGRVLLAELEPGHSTTATIARIGR